jgi:DNA-binding XRE family transcriptional regulator
MTDDRMDPGELQAVREYLGLTSPQLATLLGVRDDTVRRWESGRDPIPHRVREEVEQIEEATARAVDEVVTALEDARDVAVTVYRTDADMHAARPDLAHLPARWWRHVVMRACERVDGVEIVTAPRA